MAAFAIAASSKRSPITATVGPNIDDMGQGGSNWVGISAMRPYERNGVRVTSIIVIGCQKLPLGAFQDGGT